MQITIDGLGRVTVDDAFATLPPDEQQRIVEDIARQAGITPGGEAPTQRLRAAAQGLTLGFADEIEARARAMLPGETYDEALEDVRGKVDAYRRSDPMGAIAYEVGGAAIPALAGLFTGGAGTAATATGTAARLAPTMARAAKIGATEAAIHGFGDGEGGFVNRSANAALQAPMGAIGGAVGSKAVDLASRPFVRLVDTARRGLGGKASNAVANEVQRLAQEAGLSVDDVVARLENGEVMGEMTATLRAALRANRSLGGEAAETIDRGLRGRAAQTREEAMGQLQGALTPGFDGNVLKRQLADTAAQKATERAGYRAAYDAMPEATDAITDAVEGVLRADPAMARAAARAAQLRPGMTPFFRVRGNKVELLRRPSLEEAEIVRRSLADAASKSYKDGQGTIGEALGDLEKGLRTPIDDGSKALAAVREGAATVRTAREAFASGMTALSRAPDEVAVEWDAVQDAGEAAVKAYRAGVMSALRRRSTTGQRASMMTSIADDTRGEGLVLRMILSPQQADEVIGAPLLDFAGTRGAVGRAAQAQLTEDAVLRGSQTAETTLQAGRIGAGGMLSDVASLASGSPAAALRIAGRVAEDAMKRMTDQQRAQVARLMLETDPRVLQAALTDESGLMILQRLVENAVRRTTMAGAMAGGVAAPVAAIQPAR